MGQSELQFLDYEDVQTALRRRDEIRLALAKVPEDAREAGREVQGMLPPPQVCRPEQVHDGRAVDTSEGTLVVRDQGHFGHRLRNHRLAPDERRRHLQFDLGGIERHLRQLAIIFAERGRQPGKDLAVWLVRTDQDIPEAVLLDDADLAKAMALAREDRRGGEIDPRLLLNYAWSVPTIRSILGRLGAKHGDFYLSPAATIDPPAPEPEPIRSVATAGRVKDSDRGNDGF